MSIYVCPISDTRYDSAVGDPAASIAPGTAFTDLPATWTCPDCGTPKEDFIRLDDRSNASPMSNPSLDSSPADGVTSDAATVLRQAVRLSRSSPNETFDAMGELYPFLSQWSRERFANAILDLIADAYLNVESIGTDATFVTDAGFRWVAENPGT